MMGTKFTDEPRCGSRWLQPVEEHRGWRLPPKDWVEASAFRPRFVTFTGTRTSRTRLI